MALGFPPDLALAIASRYSLEAVGLAPLLPSPLPHPEPVPLEKGSRLRVGYVR